MVPCGGRSLPRRERWAFPGGRERGHGGLLRREGERCVIPDARPLTEAFLAGEPPENIPHVGPPFGWEKGASP